MKLLDSWKLVLLLCLTLGLAPYFPEPHLWGKLKWVAGGAVGMAYMDWFDLLLHGTPFLLLLRIIIIKVRTPKL
ncbi:hypothetical protein [Muriicola sp.]|uniref:hypothetical protein n=1 Tax=Muriicola sp. TaxID=2020856 RepID=UPI003C723A55